MQQHLIDQLKRVQFHRKQADAARLAAAYATTERHWQRCMDKAHTEDRKANELEQQVCGL